VEVVRGFLAYHTMPTNSVALSEFRGIVLWHCLRAFRRRGQRDKTTWISINQLANRRIPSPRVLHLWSSQRFAVKY
jgi:hypothetical protein